ncbi:uncharacterized protein OCT59_010310 [Rhizophagus irregularis]|uniref:uncharacterized protein n=1 Tax=Rhizophagus irregularis TaxID=588596 RepID=UPI003328A8E3|nr:hypothetical protein OCT59_010310 [Rhizophagus irregularis]
MDSKKQSNSSTNITVLKLKRRKAVKTNLSIPTHSQEIGQVYIIGSNEFSQCGTLGCFTESPKSVEAKLIFERGNYNIVEEVKPVYAEGLDNGKNGVIRFSYNKCIEQPIFTQYTSFKNFKIVNISAGQYSLDTSKQAIIPLKRHSFFNKIGQKVEEFAASEYHTLAHMQNEQVFSFE